MSDMIARKDQAIPQFDPGSCWRKGCLVFVLVPLALLLAGVIIHLLSGEPMVTLDMVERQLAGFAFDLDDPAGYWGPDSASLEINHERFDRIVVNARPANNPGGFVTLVMRDGRMIFFYVDSPTPTCILINEKRFHWGFNTTRDARDIATKLSESDYEDLLSVNELLLNPGVVQGLQQRTEVLLGGKLPLFHRAVEAIVKERQHVTTQNANGSR